MLSSCISGWCPLRNAVSCAPSPHPPCSPDGVRSCRCRRFETESRRARHVECTDGQHAGVPHVTAALPLPNPRSVWTLESRLSRPEQVPFHRHGRAAKPGLSSPPLGSCHGWPGSGITIRQFSIVLCLGKVGERPQMVRGSRGVTGACPMLMPQFCNGIPLHEDTRESLGQIDKRIAFHRRTQAAPNLGSQTCMHYKS
ncbi:hypothetical protein BT67DRAFT_310436 [Trichocladium antarcticum]|uniref:Uncharacterized protein n=1 Tax=Trichocladium antarcticum TaxID=1450529 RepID=A0AAN6ULZ0_9PEZI|nr:hypothetical protein BT67DRAFT_310436 [Trichocladium antarcticum]